LYASYDLDSLSEFEAASSKVEQCIADISQWMSENKLKLNSDKTELMVFSSAWQKHKVAPISLHIGDDTVSPAAKVKNLGVFFDPHLTMEKHINSICQSSAYHLRNIGKIEKYLTKESLLKVIHAFVSSRLDCNNSLLFGLPDKQIKKLQRLQNSAARIVTKTRKDEHITPHLINLHWLPVRYRIDFKILTLTYKCLHSEAPQYLSDLLQIKELPRVLRSSTAPSLVVPAPGTTHYKDRAFSSAAPVLWNKLPAEIRTIQTLDSFKASVKTYLFTKLVGIKS
jgi:hypothetical protein